MLSIIDWISPLIPSSRDIVALAILLVLLPLFVFLTVRAKNGARFALRPIAAYARLRSAVSQATESAQPVHVALGSGQIGGAASTAESIAGLTAFDYVARHAAASNQTTLATSGEATLLLASQGILQNAREEAGFPEAYQGGELAFGGPDAFAYAAHASRLFQHKGAAANVLIGHLGPEALWLSESLTMEGVPQVGGATDPATTALMAASLDETLVGEEIFAAGAYLHRPSHLGSLATQDMMRIVLIVSILAGLLLTTLGIWS